MSHAPATKEELKEKFDPKEVLRYAKDEKQSFLVFDLFVGSAALWLPLLLGALFYPHSSPWKELVALLNSGGGYTFSIAFLATSGSFLFLDRRRKTVNDARDRVDPYIWTKCQVSLLIGTFLTAAHVTHQILMGDNQTTLLNLVQFIFVLWTIKFSIDLFCLKHIDKLPNAIENYRKKVQEDAGNIGDQAKKIEEF